MEYTDIDAQDKFFRQSRSANTPFTDGISYDWSYPSGAPVSYGRSAEGMITIRKEIASQQSLEQQAIWFRINRQSKIRTCFGGVDDQNQPISCKIQLSIAPEKRGEHHGMGHRSAAVAPTSGKNLRHRAQQPGGADERRRQRLSAGRSARSDRLRRLRDRQPI
ncbi:hypothetical protein IC615_08980 [Serratia ureilytica]